MKYPILINGEMYQSPQTMTIINPADQSVAGEVSVLTDSDAIDKVFAAAANAFPSWKVTDKGERRRFLEMFRDELDKRSETLAAIMMSEIAKSYNSCLDEVKRSVQYIDETIAIFEKELSEPVVIGEETHHIKGKTGKFYREPLGVVLVISPFNYPVNLLLSKVIPALLVGNTVVYKGATQGSLAAAFISQIFYDIGMPNGVVNCVAGSGAQIGDLLVKNPLVSMIAFTGGTKAGQHIVECVPGKPLLFELGGKDPALVIEDADLDLTAKQIVMGAFAYNGQRCTAIKRAFVPTQIHDVLVQKMNALLATLTVGMPKDNTFITPLISAKSVNYVQELINDAVDKGAKLQQEVKVEGNLLYPVIIDNVTDQMRIAWEEQFGPVLPIIPYDDINQAMEMINDSEYGLQASVFTQNMEQATVLAKNIEAGTVNINRSSSRGPDIFPFSGVKSSGIGVQGLRDTLYAMTKVKGIVYNE